MLQAVRTCVPERFPDRPAVVVLQLHQHTAGHIGGILAGLPSREAARDPYEQFSPKLAALIGYRGSRGCRILVLCHDLS